MIQPIKLIEKHINKINRINKWIEIEQSKIADLQLTKRDSIEYLPSHLNIPLNEIYTFKVNEYRDDRVSCFQAAQRTDVLLINLYFHDKGFIYPIVRKLIYTPTGKIKTKNGKYYTKQIYYNQFLDWELIDKQGNIVLSYKQDQVLILNKYTDLDKVRENAYNIQKF